MPSVEQGSWGIEQQDFSGMAGYRLGYTFGSVTLETPDDGTDVLRADDLRDLRTAITAALGDGAIVVTAERLRDAWDRNVSCNRPKPCDICDLHFGRWLAALTAPEVEG